MVEELLRLPDVTMSSVEANVEVRVIKQYDLTEKWRFDIFYSACANEAHYWK